MSQKQIFFMMISVQADEGVAQKDFFFFFLRLEEMKK